MSERDSVHTEIEKLQERVDAREARIAQLEKQTKEHEAEVKSFIFALIGGWGKEFERAEGDIGKKEIIRSLQSNRSSFDFSPPRWLSNRIVRVLYEL